jgi:hypothetical protein
MDRLQAEAALSRALELEATAAADVFDRDALERLGLELGVSPESLDQALGDVLGAPAGPLNAAAARTIVAPVEEVEAAIESLLRLRGLTTDGGSVWRQGTGWWPDLFRFRAVTPVAVSVIEAGTGTTVRFMARLDHLWRAHLVAAILVPLLAALLLGIGELVASLFLGLAWVAVCGLGYRYRRGAVRRRLEGALRELSRPDYRSQPW